MAVAWCFGPAPQTPLFILFGGGAAKKNGNYLGVGFATPEPPPEAWVQPPCVAARKRVLCYVARLSQGSQAGKRRCERRMDDCANCYSNSTKRNNIIARCCRTKLNVLRCCQPTSAKSCQYMNRAIACQPQPVHRQYYTTRVEQIQQTCNCNAQMNPRIGTSYQSGITSRTIGRPVSLLSGPARQWKPHQMRARSILALRIAFDTAWAICGMHVSDSSARSNGS